jgi:predicted permease
VLAAFAGVAVSLSGLGVWPPLMTAIRMVGDIAVPLMLLALGVRLADSRIAAVGFGLAGALLRPLAGAGTAWLAALAFGLPEREQAMLLIYGALPPAVLNYMFAERYAQEPDRVASIVLIGNAIAPLVLSAALAVALR